MEEVPCKTDDDLIACMVHDLALEFIDRFYRPLFDHKWDLAGFVVKRGKKKGRINIPFM